jgi:hypothetical protein
MAKTRVSGDDEAVQPRNIKRADIAPSIGFALVVDGHLKSKYDDHSAANNAAEDLLSRFPKLHVHIYDAARKRGPWSSRRRALPDVLGGFLSDNGLAGAAVCGR